MPLDENIIGAVANANFKTAAEMATQNMIAHQNRIQVLAEKALAKSLESMDTLNVTEGLGIAAAQRGDLSKTIADLAAAVSSIQQMLKGAQTTPPESES